MTTQLTIHTQAADTPNRFNSYWAVGRKQGVIEVIIPGAETADAGIIAELSALHYLLSHKSVLGEGRAGNSVEINVTYGAIRKLAQNTSNKKHLFLHARFLLTRYAEASINVAKDNSWIVMERVANRRDEITVREPIPEVVEVSGVGKVGLSHHIIERMMERANYASISAAWRHLCKMLGGGRLIEAPIPANVAAQKAAKHGSVGRHLRVPNEPWRFVLSQARFNFGESMPMLVTAYVRA